MPKPKSKRKVDLTKNIAYKHPTKGWRKGTPPADIKLVTAITEPRKES